MSRRWSDVMDVIRSINSRFRGKAFKKREVKKIIAWAVKEVGKILKRAGYVKYILFPEETNAFRVSRIDDVFRGMSWIDAPEGEERWHVLAYVDEEKRILVLRWRENRRMAWNFWIGDQPA